MQNFIIYVNNGDTLKYVENIIPDKASSIQNILI